MWTVIISQYIQMLSHCVIDLKLICYTSAILNKIVLIDMKKDLIKL